MTRHRMALPLVVGFVALISAVSADFPDCINGPLSNNAICDYEADPYERATALVKLFTFDEKIINTQNKSPGVPRIGLPRYEWWSEALHGVAGSPGVSFTPSGNYSYATSFPQPITLGATFDDDLVHSIATVISTEARAFSNGNKSGLNYWTPNINPYKDPRWGRGQETPGEDPFHLSSYVKQLIIGLQGGQDAQPYKKIVATCKHYAGYDIEDWKGNARYGFNAIISPQDLREYYLPPFQQCARDSNVQSVMCSYNAVNGVPTCADNYLLQTILREYWGWTDEDQWVTSDCDAVHNIYQDHKYTKTPQQAVAAALNAGTDLDCGTYYPDHLGQAYNESLYNISTLDRSLIRRYASLVRLGYFDPPSKQPYRQLTFADVSTNASQSLALKAAENGIVLLKNDGTLPLSSSIKSVAIVGPWANATKQMQGNYYGAAPYLHSPAYAAQQAGFSAKVSNGTGISSNDASGFANALAAARQADAIIYVGGIDNSIESEAHDRNDILWPGNQLNLISQLSNLTKPMIVVQMGTQVDSSSIVSNPGVGALVWAGYPGQDGGTAIMNILTGKVAPAGRLPVTQYPGKYVDGVPMTNMSLRPFQSDDGSLNNPGRTYKWYTGKPIFEFGHGLHYTNFSAKIKSPSSATYSISSLLSRDSHTQTQKTYKDLTSFDTFQVTITNTGKVSSDFVILRFLTGSFGPTPYPKRSLVAYKRLHLVEAGGDSQAELKLNLGSLARVDENGDMVLYPGDYSFVIDNDEKAAWNFTLTGEKMALDAWPKPPAPKNVMI
ncbi:uncharacterized protein BP5553_01510 [Venustampulla echinocandica]|uniref:xylan 1,4-beta-xylosidase n=1 Tax=Venustampulla echinocandica TaxID=2656787 RepID=A0A370U178_9HELO|nr:uncharacterized protein BP5553_01510 [Venustampulla echinocandica]RDL41531.1 hypothetical protein BP5553_01510 [Venustampulla echinocandica]